MNIFIKHSYHIVVPTWAPRMASLEKNQHNSAKLQTIVYVFRKFYTYILFVFETSSVQNTSKIFKTGHKSGLEVTEEKKNVIS